MAVHVRILFNDPHGRPTALLDHRYTQDLFAEALRAAGPLFASYVTELQGLSLC